MLALLATLALSVTPSAHALAANGQHRGWLVTPVQYGGETQAEVPLSQMTRQQLKAEYKRLEEEMPGRAGQITMIALGGATMGGGVIALYVALLFSIGIGGNALVPAVIGLGLLLGGGALLTVGIIMLRMVNAERKPFNEAMDEIQQRLDGKYEEQRQREQEQERPYDPVVPPPPPPPPPGAGFPDVRPSLVVATF